MQTCCWKLLTGKVTEMDGAEVKLRMVARQPSWGFDALGMFFPFEHKEFAEIAASTWTEDFLRKEGGLPIDGCPLAPNEAEDGEAK
jgi:hypothetical protein